MRTVAIHYHSCREEQLRDLIVGFADTAYSYQPDHLPVTPQIAKHPTLARLLTYNC